MALLISCYVGPNVLACSRTDHPVTLHDVYFVPDLGFNLFSFHVVQEKHEIILNKTGAHLLNGRLVFPRRSNGSPLRATRVMPGVHASASLLHAFLDSCKLEICKQLVQGITLEHCHLLLLTLFNFVYEFADLLTRIEITSFNSCNSYRRLALYS